jgi:hypothetical protein
MNLDALQKKLIASARREPADDRVPYAFEKRVMAHLAARSGVDQWVLLARGLWRAAVSCTMLALLVLVVSLFLPKAADGSKDLSQDFENTLLASVDQIDSTP